MNYLAHCFLSFDDPDLLAGQWIADDIKGKKYEEFEGRVKTGILLHRFVDHFTDTSEQSHKLRVLLRPELGLFSGIAIDVFFDYFLSIHWSEYSNQKREDFIGNTYRQLLTYKGIMTDRRRYILDKMIETDWLGRYDKTEGIALTLNQMSRRVPGGEVLSKAHLHLEKNKKIMDEVFEIFFPKLISASKNKLDTFAP